MKEVSGETLAQWDVKWRAHLAKHPKEPLSPMFGLGVTPPGLGDSRERSRLAELLVGRDHPAEALTELDKIPADMLADPSLRYLRARVLEGADNAKQAESLLEEPKLWTASYGPCWAVRGRLARARGDQPTADLLVRGGACARSVRDRSCLSGAPGRARSPGRPARTRCSFVRDRAKAGRSGPWARINVDRSGF